MLPGALRVPIVQAPLAGGASTPALTAAVVERRRLRLRGRGLQERPTRCATTSRATRALTDAPFGVNVFVPGRATARGPLRALHRGAARRGRAPGRRARRAALRGRRAGTRSSRCSRTTRWPRSRSPSAARHADVVARLQAVGSTVWVTVTDVAEAAARRRGRRRRPRSSRASRPAGTAPRSSTTTAPATTGCWRCCSSCGAHVDLPLVASGAIASGGALAAVLCRGRAGRAARHRLHALPRGRHVAARTGRRSPADAPDAPHARVHRPPGARHRQSLPARALRRRAAGLPRDPPRHRAAARRRAGAPATPT